MSKRLEFPVGVLKLPRSLNNATFEVCVEVLQLILEPFASNEFSFQGLVCLTQLIDFLLNALS